MSLPKKFYSFLIVLGLVHYCRTDSGKKMFFQPGMMSFVKSAGYPIEEHEVTTEDGYMLKIHRIPYGMSNKNTKNRPPVILMHGLYGSSENWIALGKKKSLSFMAAEAGYDVWLPNARGNMHSRQHSQNKMNPDANAMFWDFSWHEIGKYDIPRVIDYILEKTGQKKVDYIGHSQGGTVMLVMQSERPEYNAKVGKFIGLAPGTTFNHIKSDLLIDLMAQADSVYDAKLQVNEREKLFWVNYDDVRLASFAIGQKYPHLIPMFANRYFGESDVTDWNAVSKFAGTMPAGASNKQVMHYCQVRKLKRFTKFDYGPAENLKRYNSTTPSNYNFKNMNVPTYFMGAQNDILVTVDDLREFASQLPNVKENYVVPMKKFTHFDFILARNADRGIHKKIINILNSDKDNKLK